VFEKPFKNCGSSGQGFSARTLVVVVSIFCENYGISIKTYALQGEVFIETDTAQPSVEFFNYYGVIVLLGSFEKYFWR